MKMFCLFFVLCCLVFGVMVGMAGCASTMGEPGVGKYTYVRMPLYEGAAKRTIPIWVDKGFGEADRLAIDDAIGAWNFALNGYLKLSVVDMEFDMEVPKIVMQVNQGGWLLLRITSDNPLIPNNRKGYWTIGFVEHVGGHHLYLVRDRLANEAVFGVTLHEIGHLLGAGHVGNHLMNPHYSLARFQCIDYETIVAVAAYWGLPADRLNYCIDKEVISSELTKKPLDGAVEELNCPLGLPDSH